MFKKGDKLINKNNGTTATFLGYSGNLIMLVVHQFEYSCMSRYYSYHVESDWQLMEA